MQYLAAAANLFLPICLNIEHCWGKEKAKKELLRRNGQQTFFNVRTITLRRPHAMCTLGVSKSRNRFSVPSLIFVHSPEVFTVMSRLVRASSLNETGPSPWMINASTNEVKLTLPDESWSISGYKMVMWLILERVLRISDKGYLPQSRSCKKSQDMGDIYGAVQNVFQILQLTPPSGGFFPGRFGVEVASSNDLTPSYRFIAAVHSDIADRTVLFSGSFPSLQLRGHIWELDLQDRQFETVLLVQLLVWRSDFVNIWHTLLGRRQSMTILPTVDVGEDSHCYSWLAECWQFATFSRTERQAVKNKVLVQCTAQ